MAVPEKKIKLTEFPKITSIAATEDKGVQLEWTSVKHAEKYVIKRSTSPDGEFQVVDRTTELCFTDTTAEPDTIYWYKIIAWRWLDAKKGSMTESAVKAMTVSDIPAVSNLKAEEKDGRILLSWDKSGGDRFLIYKRNDYCSKYMSITETRDCSFCDPLPVSGQAYHYSVQLIKEADGKELYGSFSKEISCAFIDQTEILSTRKIIGKKALINVRIIAGADGYIFERCDKKDGNFSEAGRTEDITAVDFEDKLPSRIATYGYRVCAYKKVGDSELRGKYSEVRYI